MVTVVDDGFDLLFTRTTRACSKSLKRKRPSIMKCQCCGKTSRLTIHHIIPISVNPNLKYRVDNMVVLCQDCHTDYGHCGYTGKFYNPRVMEDIKTKDAIDAFQHRVSLKKH